MASVIGYHGTTIDAANIIVRDGSFQLSQSEYNWLGNGAYFFEGAPLRAWMWAKRKAAETGSEPAVVRATIDLRDCLDLLDVQWFPFLRLQHELCKRVCVGLAAEYPDQKAPVMTFIPVNDYLVEEVEPKRTVGKNELDCRVVNDTVRMLTNSFGKVIRSVRAAFFEGYPVYHNSYIYTRNHVQIAVIESESGGVLSELMIETSSKLESGLQNLRKMLD